MFVVIPVIVMTVVAVTVPAIGLIAVLVTAVPWIISAVRLSAIVSPIVLGCFLKDTFMGRGANSA